ncbi:hypothetical protein MSAN_01458600 [Mycena sanguinolenta]|uniref:Uncharacterized protein n=1 Tax=Mycena sanguinolenta TaxID=230812 RepID=A0A8H7CYM1_9AGAR|nr:hypothetical protein MSAN_01458600 [Mycena sanguinolenta]
MPSDLSSITSDNELWAYASGTIVSLRDRLASECRAHAETHRVACARISALEARIAYQDAELEERIMHASQTLPRASGSMRTSPTHNAGLPLSLPPIPISEVNALHRRKLADKLLLEKEVEQLTEQLEKARLEANPVVLPSDARQMVSESVPHPLTSQQLVRHILGGRSAINRILSPLMRVPREALRADDLVPLGEVPAQHPQEGRGRDPIPIGRSALVLPAPCKQSLRHRFVCSKTGENVHPNPLARPTSRRSNQPNEVGPQVRYLEPPQASPPVPPPPEPGGPNPWAQMAAGPAQLFEDYDGSMSMDLATPLIPTVILPVAGPSTLPHTAGNSNFRFTPSPVLPVASTEISPLDLSSDRPLPGVTSPHDLPRWGGVDTSLQLQPGEQAVQELMDIAATAKRKA